MGSKHLLDSFFCSQEPISKCQAPKRRHWLPENKLKASSVFLFWRGGRAAAAAPQVPEAAGGALPRGGRGRHAAPGADGADAAAGRKRLGGLRSDQLVWFNRPPSRLPVGATCGFIGVLIGKSRAPSHRSAWGMWFL